MPSFEHPNLRKAESKSEKPQTDFANPSIKQPIEGLNSQTGGVPVLSSNQELEKIITEAKSKRDKRLIRPLALNIF